MCPDPVPDDRLVDYYTSDCDESARLARPKNRLEFLRTRELVRDRLPPAPVLDVGGGQVRTPPGWLPMATRSTSWTPFRSMYSPRALSLPAKAIRLVRASATRDRSRSRTTVSTRAFRSGRSAPVGKLPAAFSHRPSELAGELSDAGLVDVELLGIEGPGMDPVHTLPRRGSRRGSARRRDSGGPAMRRPRGHDRRKLASARLWPNPLSRSLTKRARPSGRW